MLTPRLPSRQHGVTLIELAVVFALVGILMALAVPAIGKMIGNAQVRGVSDSLQNGLRLAQAEALRRHRVTVFYRSDSQVCNAQTTASSTGPYWVIRVLPLDANDTPQVAQCGSVGDIGSPVVVTGPTAVCFSSEGRQIAMTAADIGATIGASCTVAAAHAFNLSSPRSDRPLRVRVTSGGSVRLCDPNKTYSAATPDGCPP